MPPLSRRRLLALASGLLAGLWCGPAALAHARRGLKITDPGCPASAFAEIRAYFLKLRAQQPPLSDADRLRNGRAWLAGTQEPALPGEDATWAECGGSGRVKVRVLRPAGELQGVVLAIHGGGWAMGSALSDEKRNWALARHAKVAVVSPEYRLAPEHPFPAAPEDCLQAARWLLREGPVRFGVRSFAVVGASAGAHLAAHTLQSLPLALRRRILCTVLYYGVYDLGRSEVWRRSTEHDFPDLSPAEMNLFLSWFLPGLDDESRRSPVYSPMYASLEGLPPALFLVGGADLLADDTRRFAHLWSEAGNQAELVEYPGAPHGFNGFGVACGLDPDLYAAQFVATNLTRDA